MRIIITGGKGMLGRTLCNMWSKHHQCIVADLPEADITDLTGFTAFLKKNQPDAVIHCAAMTKVDDCESKPELAELLNVQGSRNVALACKECQTRLIAISTDYVFDGQSASPYNEADEPNPATVYGKTKRGGEKAIQEVLGEKAVIARIAWLYGAGGPSFIHTMVKLADGTRDALKVVNDQLGNPTSTEAVAEGLAQLLEHPELGGVFHLSCTGEATWYELAVETFKILGINQKVLPCTTDEFPRPAPRPANSRLAKTRQLQYGLKLPVEWHDALQAFLLKEFK